MRRRGRNFENKQSQKAIMGSACSPILLVLLVTLSGCIVSFSSESVPIHTFCSQGPSPINSHDNAMHIGRCPCDYQSCSSTRASLEAELEAEIRQGVHVARLFRTGSPRTAKGIPQRSVRKHYSPHDGRRQGGTHQWAGNRYDDAGGGLRHTQSPARGQYLMLKRSRTRLLRPVKYLLIETEVESCPA